MPFEEREFFQQRLSEAEIRQILGDRSPRDLFAWKSVKARQLGLANQDLSDEQLIKMMAEEPTFIRRPLIIADGQWVAGFNARDVDQLVG